LFCHWQEWRRAVTSLVTRRSTTEWPGRQASDAGQLPATAQRSKCLPPPMARPIEERRRRVGYRKTYRQAGACIAAPMRHGKDHTHCNHQEPYHQPRNTRASSSPAAPRAEGQRVEHAAPEPEHKTQPGDQRDVLPGAPRKHLLTPPLTPRTSGCCSATCPSMTSHAKC